MARKPTRQKKTILSRIRSIKLKLPDRAIAGGVLALLITASTLASPIPFILRNKQRENFRRSIASNAVKVYDPTEQVFASGSKVLAPSGKSYFLTNFHVCQAYATSNGSEYSIKVGYSLASKGTEPKVYKIVDADAKADLCLIETNETGGFKIAGELIIGESVFLLGHPAGSELMMIEGEYVSKKDIMVADSMVSASMFTANEISSISYGGNSGSAVLNSYGRVVGVLFAGSLNVKLQNYMVPLEKVQNFLSKY